MKHPDLLQDNVRGLFLKYLFPSVSATLVTSIYILADTLMIGRGVGPIGIAALNILLPLFTIFFGTGMLFGVGGSVLLSISKGRNDEKGAREYFTIACVLAAIVSVVYVAGCYLFFNPITAFLGRNETMDFYVREYGIYLVGGAPVFLFSSMLQAFVRNDKAPKRAMLAVIAGGVSNVVLDYIFIFPMKMGMAGGAIASVIGSLITFGILLTHFFEPSNTLKFADHIPWKKAKDVFFNGISSFLLEVSNGIVMFLFNRQLLTYVGDLGVVVYSIISNSSLIVASVCNGISQATQPLLAVNFGAGKWDRVALARKLGQVAVGIAGFLFLLCGFLFPVQVTKAFVVPTEEILNLAIPAVRIYFIAFFAMGFNMLFSTYFQSVLRPQYSMLICLMRGLVLNGIFVFTLPVFFGVYGIWITIVLSEFITLGIGIVLLKRAKVCAQRGQTRGIERK